MSETLLPILKQLRSQKPVVLCLTNVVTMDLVANGLLALGAAPIMSLCDTELPELIPIAQAVYLNIGTLDEAFIERCQQAQALAKQCHKPLVLDPVGAGASAIRTQTARDLLMQADIVKGNASEIMALVDDTVVTQGVESTYTTDAALAAANHIANTYGNIVVVSGAIDHVISATRSAEMSLGDAMMGKVTGMGCLLGALISAFTAITEDHFQAAYCATQYMGQCGSLAAAQANGPATFRRCFIDALYCEATLQTMNRAV
jgi:hydroxyethylthiazole kinase